MSFTCRYTVDDFQKAFQAHYHHHATWRWLLRAAILFGCFSVLFGLAVMFEAPTQPVFFLAPFLLGALWLWIGFGGHFRRFARLQFLGNPGYREEFKIEANEEGIRSDYSIGRNEATWQAFIRHVETTEMFLLYCSPYQFHILPKRIFQAAELTEFRELLKRKLS